MFADHRCLLSSQLSVGMCPPATGPSVQSVVVRRLSTSIGFVGRLPSVRLSPLAGRGHLSTAHLGRTLDHACQSCSRSCISVVLSATRLCCASQPYSWPCVLASLLNRILGHASWSRFSAVLLVTRLGHAGSADAFQLLLFSPLILPFRPSTGH